MDIVTLLLSLVKYLFMSKKKTLSWEDIAKNLVSILGVIVIGVFAFFMYARYIETPKTIYNIENYYQK